MNKIKGTVIGLNKITHNITNMQNTLHNTNYTQYHKYAKHIT